MRRPRSTAAVLALDALPFEWQLHNRRRRLPIFSSGGIQCGSDNQSPAYELLSDAWSLAEQPASSETVLQQAEGVHPLCYTSFPLLAEPPSRIRCPLDSGRSLLPRREGVRKMQARL